jgi:mono/diheme cytochrome c family protein
MMNDAQVAAVVNYVRTHFGNRFGGTATEQDVATARQ